MSLYVGDCGRRRDRDRDDERNNDTHDTPLAGRDVSEQGKRSLGQRGVLDKGSLGQREAWAKGVLAKAETLVVIKRKAALEIADRAPIAALRNIYEVNIYQAVTKRYLGALPVTSSLRRTRTIRKCATPTRCPSLARSTILSLARHALEGDQRRNLSRLCRSCATQSRIETAAEYQTRPRCCLPTSINRIAETW